MKNLTKSLILGIFVTVFLVSPLAVFAGTPQLMVTREGTGDNVKIVVQFADSYSQVTLYRRQSTSLWTVITNFGQTDSSGYFSTVASLGSDGSNNPVEQYVVVNGLQSNIVQTYPFGSSVGNLTLSQSYVSLNVGQSQSISIYVPYFYSGSFYVSSNSNTNAVSASIVGSTLNLYGQNNGSSTITVCQYNSSQCGNVYVTVGGDSGYISLSQTSVSLPVGQNQIITIYSSRVTYGNYYVSSNSNPNVVSVTVSGNTLVLFGLSSGNSTVTVCQSGFSQCASVYVSVYGGSATSGIQYVSVIDDFFSPNTVTVAVGVTVVWINHGSRLHTVTADDGSFDSGNLYSGASFSRVFNSPGTYRYYCKLHGGAGGRGMSGTIVVTGSSVGNLTLSQSYVSLNVGQSQSISIYVPYFYSGSFYVSSNSNTNAVSASIVGSTLNLYGQNNGSSTITVCQYNSSQCGNVYVTVGGGYGNIWLNQSSLSLAVGQSAQLNIFGSSGNFYILSNSNPNAASASVQGSILNIRALNGGSATVTVCGAANQCTSVFVIVGGGSLQYPGGVLGEEVYNNGALIKENGTVFIVYKNTKTGFASLSAFEGLGYRLSNVAAVGSSGLVDSGFVVTTSRGAHPWGSWIKSGNTVYFVHELGLIPIPTYDVFLNNGGNSSLVVPANSFDFKLPMLSMMVINDSRLR